jgi:hypothetical protein
MKRSQHDGPFLVVEGADDTRFYRRFVDSRYCQLVPAFSKDNVIGAISELDRGNFAGVLGIIDSDFDILMGKALLSANVVRGDDCHDVESMLIRSEALDAVLHEFASPDKLRSFEAEFAGPFRSWLILIAQNLGYLRWHSLANGINLCFDGLRFSDFIDVHSLALDRTALFKAIRNQSRNWTITDAELTQAGWPQNRNDDTWQVCCGHDMVDLLAIALRRAIGSQQQLNSERLRTSLRLAFSVADFANSRICASIRNWERSNKIQILRAFD